MGRLAPKESWRSPVGRDTLGCRRAQQYPSQQENAHGQVYARASSCTLGVMTPSGRRVASHVVETNARCLIEAVRRIPQPRHICLEEGTLSEWLYEVLSPHAEKVVVAAVSESRGPKDDRRDAFGLAEGLRLGAIKRKVYKERGSFGALGYRAKGYRWIRSDEVRVKNRLKALYRSRGVAVAGRGVYAASKRGEYLDRLPKPAQPLAELLYAQMDALDGLRREAKKAMLAGHAPRYVSAAPPAARRRLPRRRPDRRETIREFDGSGEQTIGCLRGHLFWRQLPAPSAAWRRSREGILQEVTTSPCVRALLREETT